MPCSTRVPRSSSNLANDAGWAGHAGAVTKTPSAIAWSPRARSAPDFGASERVLPLGAQPRVSDRPGPARARHRAGAVQPARPWLPDRDGEAGGGVSGRRLPAGRSPVPGGANFDANTRAASVVRELATRLDATPGQVALAWLLHKGDDVVPIPGTKRRRYLEENVAAARRGASPGGGGRAALRRADDGVHRPVGRVRQAVRRASRPG